MRILFYFLVCINIALCKITIKDAGVATLTRGDVGMIFYLTLQNIGSYKYYVNVKMIMCCESISEGDSDCKLMNLMGGDMGLLQPNVTKNISLLYPNMYLHNRKGQCLISIKYTTEKNSTYDAKERIYFDTLISERQALTVLRGYYEKHEYTKCGTVDQDSLDTCEPVNCHMKYLGCRNYFNHKWKRCQTVPVCIADPDKDLPDVSYLPISNTCHDLEDLISVEDLKYLEKGIVERSWENEPTPELSANLRCHHGILSNETGFCVCDEGWMSAPLDKDQYEPSLSIYHMCNIEISTWNGINSTKIKMTILVIAIFGALFATCTIMLSFICHLLYKCMKAHRVRSLKENCESQTETELSKNNGQTDTSQNSITSEDSFVKSVPSGSLKTAAKRNSAVIYRKSIHGALLDHNLQIVEKSSKSSRGNTASDEEILLPDSEDETYVEKTEAFRPVRQ